MKNLSIIVIGLTLGGTLVGCSTADTSTDTTNSISTTHTVVTSNDTSTAVYTEEMLDEALVQKEVAAIVDPELTESMGTKNNTTINTTYSDLDMNLESITIPDGWRYAIQHDDTSNLNDINQYTQSLDIYRDDPVEGFNAGGTIYPNQASLSVSLSSFNFDLTNSDDGIAYQAERYNDDSITSEPITVNGAAGKLYRNNNPFVETSGTKLEVVAPFTAEDGTERYGYMLATIGGGDQNTELVQDVLSMIESISIAN